MQDAPAKSWKTDTPSQLTNARGQPVHIANLPTSSSIPRQLGLSKFPKPSLTRTSSGEIATDASAQDILNTSGRPRNPISTADAHATKPESLASSRRHKRLDSSSANADAPTPRAGAAAEGRSMQQQPCVNAADAPRSTLKPGGLAGQVKRAIPPANAPKVPRVKLGGRAASHNQVRISTPNGTSADGTNLSFWRVFLMTM